MAETPYTETEAMLKALAASDPNNDDDEEELALAGYLRENFLDGELRSLLRATETLDEAIRAEQRRRRNEA